MIYNRKYIIKLHQYPIWHNLLDTFDTFDTFDTGESSKSEMQLGMPIKSLLSRCERKFVRLVV